MKDQIYFLEDGQACYLKEKLGEKYLVNKVLSVYRDEDDMEEIVSKDAIVVDVIYRHPPTGKIDEEVTRLNGVKKEALREIERLCVTKDKLAYEIETMKRTAISNEKFIINKTDILKAKELVFFEKDAVMPIRRLASDKDFRGMSVSFEIKLSETGERAWGYKMNYDSSGYSGRFLCPKHGILIDPAEQEVEETIKKRVLEFEFSDYEIARADDKYLTSPLIAKKNEYLKIRNEQSISALKSKIEKAQKELDELLVDQ